MTITWKDPPARTRGKGSVSKYAPLVAELKAHPGSWALVGNKMKSRGGFELLKKAGCEVATRHAADGTFDVYARWPEPEQDVL